MSDSEHRCLLASLVPSPAHRPARRANAALRVLRGDHGAGAAAAAGSTKHPACYPARRLGPGPHIPARLHTSRLGPTHPGPGPHIPARTRGEARLRGSSQDRDRLPPTWGFDLKRQWVRMQPGPGPASPPHTGPAARLAAAAGGERGCVRGKVSSPLLLHTYISAYLYYTIPPCQCLVFLSSLAPAGGCIIFSGACRTEVNTRVRANRLCPLTRQRRRTRGCATLTASYS